jgi:hypothetical protein
MTFAPLWLEDEIWASHVRFQAVVPPAHAPAVLRRLERQGAVFLHARQDDGTTRVLSLGVRPDASNTCEVSGTNARIIAEELLKNRSCRIIYQRERGDSKWG